MIEGRGNAKGGRSLARLPLQSDRSRPQAAARKIAADSLILLKNDRDLLPLKMILQGATVKDSGR